MMMENDLALGGLHTMQYTDHIIEIYIWDPYIIINPMSPQ